MEPSLDSLPDPPHIKQAKAALAEAGIPVEAGAAALDLAAKFFHTTTQVSRTDKLQREVNQTQHELEEISYQLTQERRKNTQLQAKVNTGPESGKIQHLYDLLRSLRRKSRKLHNVLTKSALSDDQKLAHMLAGIEKILAAEVPLPEEAGDEELAPIVISPVASQLAAGQKVKVIKKQRSTNSPLEVTQRGRIAELEEILGRYSQFDKTGAKLLKHLAGGIQEFSPQELKAAAAGNELLTKLVKHWNSVCGSVENLLGENPSKSDSTQ